MKLAVTAGATIDAVRCHVPRIVDRFAFTAERALVKAHCAIGNVRYAYSTHVPRNSVISQSPAPGRTLHEGAKVAFVISEGRR